MTPVDGITPPTKNKKKRPIKNQPVQKGNIKKNIPEQKNNNIDSRVFNNNTTQKHNLVWIVSIIIVFIIFIGWSSLIFGGKMINNSETSDNQGFLIKFSNELTNIWDKFKTDYLKIQEAAEETPQTEEERIKQLEEKVFPSFDQNN
ncbi:MAG: hypothetical protein Q8P20_06295 [bacterium]|nr:hypothetical protein [bacterium]